MIIALLILIVFILLFGAGVVKGWLKNAIALIAGFAILIGLALWIGSFLGKDGPAYAVLGIMSLPLVIWGWLKATEPIVTPISSEDRANEERILRQRRSRLP